jgi:prevent-host-death family protein
MTTVGVRDLKNKLSEYLRRVRLGESVLVTDRGEVVAEILPPGQRQGDPSVPAGLQSLAKRGLLTLGAPAGTDLYPRCHEIVYRARQPFPGDPIRTRDAIHLASLLVARSAVVGLRLLSLDARVRQAARRSGIAVEPA